MPPNDQLNLALTPPDIATDAATDTQRVDATPTDFAPPFLDDPDGIYISIAIQVYYLRNRGLAFAPVAGPPGTPVAIWRMHGGYCIKVVEWALKRIGGVPVCPNRNTGTENEVWLDEVISPTVPEQLPDGQEAVTVVGRYYYVCQASPDDTTPILIPNSQLRVAVNQNQLLPANFITTVLGPVVPPSGYNGNAINY